MKSLADILIEMEKLDKPPAWIDLCRDAIYHIRRLQDERNIFERRMLVAEAGLTQQTQSYMSVQEVREHERMMKNLREGGI